MCKRPLEVGITNKFEKDYMSLDRSGKELGLFELRLVVTGQVGRNWEIAEKKHDMVCGSCW